MRFIVLKFIIIVNKLFICLAVNLPYNHGKRELDFAHYQSPQSLENGRDFRRDYYNYYQQQNTLDDPGFTKQQDDNQTGVYTKSFNDNPMMGNTTNIHNFLEFNNPPGQMFHLIYVPMKMKNDDMTQAIQPQDNGARKLNYNQQPVKAAHNLQYTGPQMFPAASQASVQNNMMQQQAQPEQQSESRSPASTTPPPMPYFNQNRPSNNPQLFTGAGSMTAAYQPTYNNNAQFPIMPLRAPPTRPQMPTRMEAPFIPSQFLGYVPQTPPPTMRPCAASHNHLIKPVHEANGGGGGVGLQNKYPATMGQLSNNAGGNMVFMPQNNNNNNDIFRDMQRF